MTSTYLNSLLHRTCPPHAGREVWAGACPQVMGALRFDSASKIQEVAQQVPATRSTLDTLRVLDVLWV